jgi:hypothetical protein
VDVFDSCEHECGLGKFADSAGANGDALEGSPAACEQGEAAFAEAAARAQQRVVGLVVRGEVMPVGGQLWRFA